MIISQDTHGNKYEISTDDLAWRPSAYAIVLREGNILLVKEDGKYHLPGGGVD